MVYYFFFLTLQTFEALLFILKALKDILKPFKFVNWLIRGFGFWCHEQVIGVCENSL